jgi:hypothetical protein
MVDLVLRSIEVASFASSSQQTEDDPQSWQSRRSSRRLSAIGQANDASGIAGTARPSKAELDASEKALNRLSAVLRPPLSSGAAANTSNNNSNLQETQSLPQQFPFLQMARWKRGVPVKPQALASFGIDIASLSSAGDAMPATSWSSDIDEELKQYLSTISDVDSVAGTGTTGSAGSLADALNQSMEDEGMDVDLSQPSQQSQHHMHHHQKNPDFDNVNFTEYDGRLKFSDFKEMLMHAYDRLVEPPNLANDWTVANGYTLRDPSFMQGRIESELMDAIKRALSMIGGTGESDNDPQQHMEMVRQFIESQMVKSFAEFRQYYLDQPPSEVLLIRKIREFVRPCPPVEFVNATKYLANYVIKL